MKRLIILLSIFLLSACSATKKPNLISGQFKGQTPLGEIILVLKPYGRFELYFRCTYYTGIWIVLEKKRYILKFDVRTNSLSQYAISGEREIKIVNKNKIKIEGLVMKRRLFKVNYFKTGYNVLKKTKTPIYISTKADFIIYPDTLNLNLNLLKQYSDTIPFVLPFRVLETP